LSAAIFFKRLGLACAIVAGATAAVVAVMLLLVSTDAVRDKAKMELRAVTGLDPVFRGNATVTLFPSGSVSFEDVTLGDDKDPALTAERLTARLKFFPLLFGRVETADIELERPTIAMVLDRGGRSNWSRLVEALAKSRLADAKSASFSAIRITGGTVVVRDDNHGRNERFENVEISTAWPSISKSFGVTGRFTWRGETVDASVTLSDFTEALAGNRSGVKVRLTSTLGKFAFDGSLSTQPTLKVVGNLAADAPSLRQALQRAGQKPLPGGGFERFALKAQTNIVGGTIALSAVNLELDGNAAEGVITFATDGRRTLQGTLAADALDLRPYLSTVQVMTSNKKQWSEGPVALDGLNGIDVDLRLSAAAVQIGEAKVGRSAVAANLRGGNLVITIGESQAFGGLVKGAITLANLEASMDAKTQLQFTNVDLGLCLGNLFGIKRLDGKGNLALALEGSGDSVMAITHTLSGTANLTGGTGALVGINAEQLLRRLERRPLSGGNELRSGRTPYDRIAMALTLDKGAISVQEVALDGPAVKLALAGTASVPGRALDLTGTATLLAPNTGGGFELPFVVQGSWDDPIVLPDPQILIRRSGAAAPLLNAVRKNSNARDAVRSAVERLTGRPVAPESATPAAAQQAD
jgi:AsmA protein